MRYLVTEIQDYGEIAATMLASPDPGLAATWLMARARAMAQLRQERRANGLRT